MEKRTSSSSIVSALRQTPRGQLVYHRDCFRGKDLSVSRDVSEILEEVESEIRTLKLEVLAEAANKLSHVKETTIGPNRIEAVDTTIENKKSDERNEKNEDDDDEDKEKEENNKNRSPIQKVSRSPINAKSPRDILIENTLITMEIQRKMEVQRRNYERRLHYQKISEEIYKASRPSREQRLSDSFIYTDEEESPDDLRAYQEKLALEAKAFNDAAKLRISKFLKEAAITAATTTEKDEELLAKNLLMTANASFEEAFNKVQNKGPFLSVFQEAQSMTRTSVSDIKEIKRYIQKLNEIRNILIQHSAQEQQQQQQQQQEGLKIQEQETKNNDVPTMSATTPVSREMMPSQPPLPSVENNAMEVSPRNLKFYENVKSYMEQFHSQINSLPPIDKNLKFDCLKVVITTVNSICHSSRSHLKDRFEKLFKICSGETVEIGETQGKTVNVSIHPAGIAYCKDLMAKTFVSQSENVGHKTHPKSIFASAMVMSALAAAFPDFGQLLLWYFYKTCPYLVPYHPARKPEDTTDKDYYLRQGYLYENGEIEKKSDFIDRMSGVTRLYAAYTVSNMPQDFADTPLPHGLGNMWKWFASTLNLLPVPDLTAQMFYEVLDVTGHAMLEAYKRQFLALLHVLKTQYLPLIRETSSGGYVNRLEKFFVNFEKNGTIDFPSGQLELGFF